MQQLCTAAGVAGANDNVNSTPDQQYANIVVEIGALLSQHDVVSGMLCSLLRLRTDCRNDDIVRSFLWWHGVW